MKKRVPLAMMGLLIIFCISSVLFNRQATLNYGDVKEFCYEVQKAGHPISPDPETIKQYDVRTDIYGNLNRGLESLFAFCYYINNKNVSFNSCQINTNVLQYLAH